MRVINLEQISCQGGGGYERIDLTARELPRGAEMDTNATLARIGQINATYRGAGIDPMTGDDRWVVRDADGNVILRQNAPLEWAMDVEAEGFDIRSM
jgi:hypothetical protein